MARFDVALTVCTMRYVSDLHIGRINPQHFKFGLSVEQKKYDLAQFLRDRIMSGFRSEGSHGRGGTAVCRLSPDRADARALPRTGAH